MTKVVSTKLSNMEHEALLEMASIKGQNISEFVRENIMLALCGSWNGSDSDEMFEKIDALLEKNSKRFGE